MELLFRHSVNNSSAMELCKYSPTDSLKLSNKRIERRKPNWTEAENIFLLDQFGVHRDILTCKATDASTNLKKQEIWRLICQNLNSHNTLVRRTPAEVRRKWKNLVTAAKKEVWEIRHQLHLSGGSSSRKISELSQRVLQLHSSGGFPSGNPNGLYGTLLSAGLLAPSLGGSQESLSEKGSYLPPHFQPIITLSESNNNHIQVGGPPSPLSEEEGEEEGDELDSSDSRNGGEGMSDSGIYEQEGIDLRVNRGGQRSRAPYLLDGGLDKGHSEPEDELDEDEDEGQDETERMSLLRFASHLGLKRTVDYEPGSGKQQQVNHNYSLYNGRSNGLPQVNNNQQGPAQIKELQLQEKNSSKKVVENSSNKGQELIDATLRLRNHFLQTILENETLGGLYKQRLELQIEVLKLRKEKLARELAQKKPVGSNSNSLVVPGKKKNGFIYHHHRQQSLPYFRLKPKNTWINFAKRERFLNRGGCDPSTGAVVSNHVKSEPGLEKLVNGVDSNNEVKVNGVGGPISDNEEH